MNVNSILVMLNFILLSSILVLLIYQCYKIRKIHIATYSIDEIRSELMGLYAQVQATLALEKIVHLPYPLPSMRGWAGSPDFLLRIAEELLTRKPGVVIECSSGVSTLVCARMLQLNGRGHVYSLEHDPVYARKSREHLSRNNLSDWATVVDAPLVPGYQGQLWYSIDNLPEGARNVEVIVVDGPPSKTSHMARYPALPSLIERLSPNSVVILDDAYRPDERALLKKWQDEFPEFSYTDAGCEKGCVFFERKISSPA